MDIFTYSSVTERKEFIATCARFFVDELKLQKSKYSLYIMCKQSLRTKSGIIGYTIKVDKNVIIVGIDNKLSIQQFLLTLAHEMIHVKQIAKGHYTSDYSNRGNLRQYWRGIRIRAKYLNQPWEIEAYRRESLLLGKLLEKVAQNK